MTQLTIIAAVSEDNVIGRNGELPWHLSSDLRRFKKLTMGHAIIMGRKTFQSIGRALPGRLSIVLSRRDWSAPDAVTVRSLQAACKAIGQHEIDQRRAFVIGGSEIYALALPMAERICLTRVHGNVAGNAHFPPVDWRKWDLVESHAFDADDRNEFAHTFEVWRRKTDLAEPKGR